MTRVATVLAAVVALAVSAAAVASAGPSKAKVPRPGVGSFSIDIGTSEKLKANGAVLYNGHAGLGASTEADGYVANHTEGTVSVVRDRVEAG